MTDWLQALKYEMRRRRIHRLRCRNTADAYYERCLNRIGADTPIAVFWATMARAQMASHESRVRVRRAEKEWVFSNEWIAHEVGREQRRGMNREAWDALSKGERQRLNREQKERRRG
jgi:hypothetical protein